MTKDEAIKIIEAYKALLDRALNVIGDVPFYSSINDDAVTGMSIDGDKVVISAKEYESDYYGGGYMRDECAEFPIEALLMSDAALDTLRAKVKHEEAERQKKVRAAEQAVARERAEAHDRAEYARLKKKYD